MHTTLTMHTLTAENSILTVVPSRDWKYSFWVI